jgi:hypothetical protein
MLPEEALYPQLLHALDFQGNRVEGGIFLLTFYRSFGKLDRKGQAYANDQSRT